ncbi:MAG TPA: MSMEG_1061 family FMN-dependent PPOX-type flavoprotein [Thermomicrobiales bacterium]|nr:MSMEG_1061 family FMN-dependent PPOX-type flavoprotein [Thermomicrobiales bacterium]
METIDRQAHIRGSDYTVTTVEELVSIVGEPGKIIANKSTPYLTPLVTEFLQKSPYYLLATASADGACDVSPRGDPVGSFGVLDERTLVLPERPGNRRIDSLKNIVSNPHIGLLFLIPAVDETVRINGRATITRDPELLAPYAIRGKLPQLAIVVEIQEVFAHCARSILRSKLWVPESWGDPDEVPTLAAIMAEQLHLTPPDESQGKRNEEYRTRLY